jgi:deoxyribose-phosphate aldolase
MSRESLVDLITQEVLNIVKSRSPRNGDDAPNDARVEFASSSVRPVGEDPLIVVCSNPLGKSEAIRQFARLRQRWPRLLVLLTGGARRLFEDSKRPFAGFTLDPDERDFDVRVAGCSSIIIVNTSVNVLAKTALLIADTPVTGAIQNFVRSGRPVVLTIDGLAGWRANPAMTSKVDRYLQDVAGYGIGVATFEDLVEAPAAAAASSEKLPDGETDCCKCDWAGHCARLCHDRVSAMRTEGVVRVASTLGMQSLGKDVAGLIDHTLLKPDATEDQIRQLCDEARKYSFASVCVNPTWVKLCQKLLAGSRVKVCTVVGFPLGATSSEAKAAETHQALLDGAEEIDHVINVGALKAGQHQKVLEDVRAVVRVAQGKTVKVILETGLLTDEEKRKGSELSVEGGADFVKTSTGFGPGGATVADIALMREVVGPGIGVKASGGVRDYETARKMIAAGASRIGASASVAIVKGQRNEKVTGPAAGY